jgi:hypothetical protein
MILLIVCCASLFNVIGDVVVRVSDILRINAVIKIWLGWWRKRARKSELRNRFSYVDQNLSRTMVLNMKWES